MNLKEEKNFVEALDIRTKMIISILASLTVIIIQELAPLLILLSISFLYIFCYRKFKLIFFSYAFLFFMFLLAVFCVWILLKMVPDMASRGILIFFKPFLRVAILMNTTLVLVASARVSDLLSVLKSLKIPFFLFLPATVMIRFIPSFINDTKQVVESLKMKGHNINPISITFKPVLTTRLLFIPLVVKSLRTADDLSVASELKGFGYYKNITSINKNKFAYPDYLILFVTFSFIVLSLLMNFKLL